MYRLNDTVEVTLSATKEEMINIVVDSMQMLSAFLRDKQSNIAVLMATVDVKIEEALYNISNSSSTSLLLLASFLTILLMIFGIIIFIIFCCFRRSSLSLSGLHLSNFEQYNRNHDEEKVNNLQNEENLKRYTNSLKESSQNSEVSSLN